MGSDLYKKFGLKAKDEFEDSTHSLDESEMSPYKWAVRSLLSDFSYATAELLCGEESEFTFYCGSFAEQGVQREKMNFVKFLRAAEKKAEQQEFEPGCTMGEVLQKLQAFQTAAQAAFDQQMEEGNVDIASLSSDLVKIRDMQRRASELRL
jgi:hypothetical protein